MVYKQFPGIRGELQGGVLDGFDLIFGELSVNFQDEFSTKISGKSPLASFKCLYAQILILVPLIVVPGIFFKTVFSSFFSPRSSDFDENSAKLQEITPRSCLDRSGPSKTTKNNQKTKETNKN